MPGPLPSPCLNGTTITKNCFLRLPLGRNTGKQFFVLSCVLFQTIYERKKTTPKLYILKKYNKHDAFKSEQFDTVRFFAAYNSQPILISNFFSVLMFC